LTSRIFTRTFYLDVKILHLDKQRRPTMHIVQSLAIPRPAADVFALIADHRNDTRWRGGVQEMTADPVGPVTPGATVHEVLRFAGSTHVTDTVITAVDPGRSFAYEGDGTGGRVRGRRSVEPDGESSCRVTTELEVETTGALRFLEPLLAPVFRRGVRRDLHTLRSLVVDGAQAPTSTAGEPANAAALMRR
jgi:uncharacterized protein YndB with AHSA1/START domain